MQIALFVTLIRKDDRCLLRLAILATMFRTEDRCIYDDRFVAGLVSPLPIYSQSVTHGAAIGYNNQSSVVSIPSVEPRSVGAPVSNKQIVSVCLKKI